MTATRMQSAPSFRRCVGAGSLALTSDDCDVRSNDVSCVSPRFTRSVSATRNHDVHEEYRPAQGAEPRSAARDSCGAVRWRRRWTHHTRRAASQSWRMTCCKGLKSWSARSCAVHDGGCRRTLAAQQRSRPVAKRGGSARSGGGSLVKRLAVSPAMRSPTNQLRL